jgi:hypothetical protein
MTDKPTYTETLGEMTSLVAGSGVAFVSYFAAIPGLIGCLLLAAILLVPLLVLGVVLIPVAGLVMLSRR